MQNRVKKIDLMEGETETGLQIDRQTEREDRVRERKG